MAGDDAATREQATPDPDAPEKPESPTDLGKAGWRFTGKAAVAEFQRDQCTDLAAALTYYSVLSVFPAILALISLLGVFGQGQATTDALLDVLNRLGQDQVAEGRPVWKLRPVVLLITLGLVVMAALVLVGMVVSGPIARAIGDTVGLGDESRQIWDLAKWPVLLLVVSFMFALLYWASPNARQGFRWVTPGGILAVVVWVAASAAFALYVANFGSYNKTYGSLASVIIFLVWLWLSNIAILLGAELNAELERGRAIAGGHPPDEEPYMELRDTRKLRERDSL